MFIVKNRKIFYIISGILFVVSVLALIIWGFNPSIDFKGGSIMEFAYTGVRPDQATIEQALAPLNLGEHSLRPTGTNGYILRTKMLDEKGHQSLESVLTLGNTQKIEERRFNTVGPLLGEEAVGKSLWAIILVLVAIVLFIAFSFRKVSEPVSSWKYGVIAVAALVHDVFIPAGVFAVLGHFGGVEIDTLFVTALLVVLGFSVHDTIVVFDRTRENLKVNRELRTKKTFEQIVGESVSQTFVRSVNTSLTTLFALFVLYLIGAEATKLFSLALLVGITAGTYSSICLASPLLVTVETWQRNRALKK